MKTEIEMNKINDLINSIEKSNINNHHINLMIDNLINDLHFNQVDPRIHYNISKEDLFKLGILGSIFSCSIFIPQAYKIYTTKDVKGISIYTFILSFCASSIWLTYNYLDGDYPSAVTIFINLIVVSSIILMILKFSKK